MKKVILVFVFLLCSTAYAGDNIECTAGYCDGWSISTEKAYSIANNEAIFHFENHSGISAFKVQAIVNFYDSFDHYLGRADAFNKGPIHKYVTFKGKIPRNTSKMTGEIYWTDKYEGENSPEAQAE